LLFVCSAWSAPQTAVLALTNVNCLAFIMNTEYGFCAVGTEFLKYCLDEPQPSHGKAVRILSHQETDPHTSAGCFRTGHSVDEPLVSRPQTPSGLKGHGYLWRHRPSLNLCNESFHNTHTHTHTHTQLVLFFGIAVAHANVLKTLCVTPVAQPQQRVPATGGESHCSATVAVAQPASVSSRGGLAVGVH
jgi:hypothetical protein